MSIAPAALDHIRDRHGHLCVVRRVPVARGDRALRDLRDRVRDEELLAEGVADREAVERHLGSLDALRVIIGKCCHRREKR
jgi:hypothetical protein